MSKESQEYPESVGNPSGDHDLKGILRFLKSMKTDEKPDEIDYTKQLQFSVPFLKKPTDDKYSEENHPSPGLDTGLTNVQLADKLSKAQDQVRKLESRLLNLETTAKSKYEKLSKQFQQLTVDSNAFRDEYSVRKQMYLASLQEIENQHKKTNKKLIATLNENVSIRQKNKHLTSKQQSLLEEICNLKLSLKATLEDRRRLKNHLKSFRRNKELGTEELYKKTTERAEAILGRQRDSGRTTTNKYIVDRSKIPLTAMKMERHGGGEEDTILQELFFIF